MVFLVRRRDSTTAEVWEFRAVDRRDDASSFGISKLGHKVLLLPMLLFSPNDCVSSSSPLLQTIANPPHLSRRVPMQHVGFRDCLFRAIGIILLVIFNRCHLVS
jgi:hypothetical protein